jgi:Ser/Thr protein kinase RdoA (MazF antagonist)
LVYGRSSAWADVEAVARRAATRYGFTDRARLSSYELTENWTFKVEEDAGPAPAVLRLYRPGGRTQAEVRSELAWMTALRRDIDLPVAEVVPTVDGESLVTIEGETEARPLFCAAFKWVPGAEPSDEELPDWFPHLGELTARMHRHAKEWERPRWFARPRWDVETTLGARGHWGSWEASVSDPEERRQHGRLNDVVVARLERFGVGPQRFGLIHADLRLANVLVDGHRMTWLDFDDCGDSWFLYDLAATLTFNEGRPDVDDLIASWVRAYRSVEPLSSEDEAEIKTFLMLRRLMISAYGGLRSDTEFAADLRKSGYSAETCVLGEAYLSTHA